MGKIDLAEVHVETQEKLNNYMNLCMDFQEVMIRPDGEIWFIGTENERFRMVYLPLYGWKIIEDKETAFYDRKIKGM